MIVEPVSAGDMAMGAVMASSRLARRSFRLAGRLSAPVVRIAVDPPLVPHAWRPIRRFERWGRDWQEQQSSLVQASVDATTQLAANAAQVVLPMVELTPLVHGVLERLDLDAVASQALDDLDLASVVDQVIDELDVGTVLDDALREVNLTDVVVRQVDLGQVIGSALDQVDLTDIVLTRVDLVTVVYAALDAIDLTAIVQERVDLATIAEQVVDDIDLPAIISESTGSVASEAVRSVRMEGVEADAAIARLADRLLMRRRTRNATSGARLEGEIEQGDQR